MTEQAILMMSVILFTLGLIGWIYEIRTETEEDKRKKMWLFTRSLY